MNTCPHCNAALEWEPDALLIPEHVTQPGYWYCPEGCDQCVCPCGREKADDEPLCGRCYDEEHGPDEARFSNCDFPTDAELARKLDQYGGKLWR